MRQVSQCAQEVGKRKRKKRINPHDQTRIVFRFLKGIPPEKGTITFRCPLFFFPPENKASCRTTGRDDE
ncbi:Uncharacterized protein APZ42_033715 [Daphnia magna]|uniref:Uncharacterized protein n=1 Tax=Daphnia magna TaxID=35525 RepID=A0A164KTV3_9CRUS|nr:Uncharacterized protein APZ42_033715 [Daphnia magna]